MQPMKSSNLTFDEWVSRFKPIKNPLDPEAEDDGYAIDPFADAQADLIEQACEDDVATVWTRVESEGWVTITNGRHFVNREKYYITEIPCPEDEMIEIPLFDPSDFEGDLSTD